MSTPTSPKVVVATIAAIVAPAILAGIGFVQTPEGATLFASLPPVLVVMIFALLTSLATFIGGYVKKDPLRASGALYDADTIAGETAPLVNDQGYDDVGFVPVDDQADADIPEEPEEDQL